MWGLLVGAVGERLARPLVIAAGIALLCGVLGLGKCAYDRHAAAQARQDARSAAALGEAAQNAVETVTAAGRRDDAVDAIVRDAAKEIDHAPSPTAARAAALRAVCQLPEYGSDPACAVRRADP